MSEGDKKYILRTLKQGASEGKTDNELFREMNSIMNKRLYSIEGAPDNQDNTRAKIRADEIREIISQLGEPNIKTMLDFGGGEGTITGTLGRELGLDKDHIYNTDIKVPREQGDITFLLANEDQTNIPLGDGTIDLVTCLMVLHHLRHPQKTIDEFHRVLVPGGYLILREHDLQKENGRDIKQQLDMLHGFYEAVWGTPEQLENPEFPNGFYSDYREREYWTHMIENAGFVRVNNIDRLEKLYDMARIPRVYKKGARIQNPYYHYYAVYKKI